LRIQNDVVFVLDSQSAGAAGVIASVMLVFLFYFFSSMAWVLLLSYVDC